MKRILVGCGTIFFAAVSVGTAVLVVSGGSTDLPQDVMGGVVSIGLSAMGIAYLIRFRRRKKLQPPSPPSPKIIGNKIVLNEDQAEMVMNMSRMGMITEVVASLEIINSTCNIDTLIERSRYLLDDSDHATSRGVYKRLVDYASTAIVSDYQDLVSRAVYNIDAEMSRLIYAPSLAVMEAYLAQQAWQCYARYTAKMDDEIARLKQPRAKERRMQAVVDQGEVVQDYLAQWGDKYNNLIDCVQQVMDNH